MSHQSCQLCGRDDISDVIPVIVPEIHYILATPYGPDVPANLVIAWPIRVIYSERHRCMECTRQMAVFASRPLSQLHSSAPSESSNDAPGQDSTDASTEASLSEESILVFVASLRVRSYPEGQIGTWHCETCGVSQNVFLRDRTFGCTDCPW